MSKLNVGIIGCGRITDLHALGYRSSELARIATVCDVNRELAVSRGRKWGAERVCTDYREVLADPAIDAVEVITPHHLHRELVIAACEAGKHVAVQKPMALSVADCDAMIQSATTHGVKLKVFENFVFYPPYVKAKALLDQGAIGEPLSIRFKLGAAAKGGWRVPLRTWLWRLNEAECGGGPTIFDDGYHKFSLALYFLGDVASVHGWVDRSFGVFDAPAMISWRYKEADRVGYLEATASSHLTVKSKYYPMDERVEITGTDGVIWITRCTGKLLDEPALLLYRDGKTEAFEAVRDDWADSFIDSTRHFLRCILDDTPPRLDGETGKRVLQFALATLESARIGRDVLLDAPAVQAVGL